MEHSPQLSLCRRPYSSFGGIHKLHIILGFWLRACQRIVTHLEPPKNHASTLYKIGDPSLFCLYVFRSMSRCLNRNLALQYFKRTIWLQRCKYTAGTQVGFAFGFSSNMVKSERGHVNYPSCALLHILSYIPLPNLIGKLYKLNDLISFSF